MVAIYYNYCYYNVVYELRRKVKADNGTSRAERTDRERNAPERTGRKRRVQVASWNIWNIVIVIIIIIIILLCYRDGENRKDFVARRSEQNI